MMVISIVVEQQLGRVSWPITVIVSDVTLFYSNDIGLCLSRQNILQLPPTLGCLVIVNDRPRYVKLEGVIFFVIIVNLKIILRRKESIKGDALQGIVV